MIKEAIHELLEGNNLNYDMAAGAMEEMMSGEATETQMSSYLTALRMKGETIEEITASAQVMRRMASKITPDYPVMDIVGTGGDEVGTFNISTTAAFIIAAAGIPVAKHGNRSVSSKSGAADVLEKLGADLSISSEENKKILDTTGICFLFAQMHHSSMKNVAPVRKGLGERTIFNILGPLSNPAGATMQVMGVYDNALVEPLAKVLSNLGVTRGVLVCGEDGLDEATITGETHLCEIRDGSFKTYDITPEQFGLKRCKLKDLLGGTPEENAQITRDILSGKLTGPKRDDVVLNAALGIYLGIDGVSISDSVDMAQEMIDSGKALAKLEDFIKANNEVKG